ncbi:MAG TPA: methyltransferase domain-containing protein [Solirubrobacteraceae bacterium]|nr:methyltransferase domain-containing protein [Solirubrobacteraceae bacterium]
MSAAGPNSTEVLRQAVDARQWYHTLELAPGLRTPGWLDHAPIVPKVPLPASLAGRRCLDVGTFNGFWAFEMERRGGQVTAVDVLDPGRWDWPAGSTEAVREGLGARMGEGDAFELAREVLGSKVERLDRSVYELDPDELGRFDIVYVGSLLVHLRDPVRALERVRSVCAGKLVLVDGIDLALTLRCPRTPVSRLDGQGRPWWWYSNLAGLARLVEAAGFEIIVQPRLLFVPPGQGWSPRRWRLQLARIREGRYWLTAAWLGDPHGALVARPRIDA